MKAAGTPVAGRTYRIRRGPMRGRALEVERVTEFHVVAHYVDGRGGGPPFTISRLWFGTHCTHDVSARRDARGV